MEALMRFAGWTRNVWPDFFVGFVMLALAGVLIGSGDTGASVSVGMVLPPAVGYAYVVGIGLTGIALAGAIWLRKPLVASRSAGVASILFAVNAVAVWANTGDGAALGCGAYVVCSMLMLNRMAVLRYATVSPPWLAEVLHELRNPSR